MKKEKFKRWLCNAVDDCADWWEDTGKSVTGMGLLAFVLGGIAGAIGIPINPNDIM